MKTTTVPVAPKKGVKGGTARRAKQHSAKSSNIRPGGKVRTRAVQDKKDHNVFLHSAGKYKTVAEMQKVGDATLTAKAAEAARQKEAARKKPNV